jgi:hypothetical protein
LSPPGPLRTERDSLPSSGSYCPAFYLKGLALYNKILPFLVVSSIKPNNTAPSLHLHYRDFITTTNCSAPVLRIATRILMGPPLGFLPWHRNDRFPRSTQEPDSRSHHLYAGRRSGGKQVAPELIPEYHKLPVLTSSLTFRHLISGSLALASLNHT